MISNILGLLCLSSSGYYTNIIQRVTVSKATMSLSLEKRLAGLFEDEAARLMNMASSYPHILEAEFAAEFVRISSGVDSDSETLNSDMAEEPAPCMITRAVMTFCMILLTIVNFCFEMLPREDVSLAELAEIAFREECSRMAKLAVEIEDQLAFDSECLRLGSLASTIDYSHLFEKECRRLESLTKTICNEHIFEKECSRLASTVESTDKSHLFDRECRRLANLVSTINQDHVFAKECLRLAKMVAEEPSLDQSSSTDVLSSKSSTFASIGRRFLSAFFFLTMLL